MLRMTLGLLAGLAIAGGAGYATEGFQRTPNTPELFVSQGPTRTPTPTRTPRPTPDHTATQEAVNVVLREWADYRATQTAVIPTVIAQAIAHLETEADPASDCDANYADACIPIVGYDLDCPEVGYQDFRVVGDDPHGFNGDPENDDIACESD